LVIYSWIAVISNNCGRLGLVFTVWQPNLFVAEI
jgi:hypothetical protein